jgi:hypothetical protein
VLGIDIETCPVCGGATRIIACIEDPAVIEKILAHRCKSGGRSGCPAAALPGAACAAVRLSPAPAGDAH